MIDDLKRFDEPQDGMIFEGHAISVINIVTIIESTEKQMNHILARTHGIVEVP